MVLVTLSCLLVTIDIVEYELTHCIIYLFGLFLYYFMGVYIYYFIF
jgi:hypothetical protein